MSDAWLEVRRGRGPLVLGLPHTGVDIPAGIGDRFVTPWLARKDTDWWVDQLYAFADDLGASVVRTSISRSVIDVNRDPSGASLYPGQATTELCPTTTFDGEPLYQEGLEPDAGEINWRRTSFFTPYHAAITAELARLKALHGSVVLYDAHAIRSRIPRLFDGALPDLNIGTNAGRACGPALSGALAEVCTAAPFSSVVDGRFKGGWTTRHHGAPEAGVHAVQMEIACTAYMDEPDVLTPETWPPPYDARRALPIQALLRRVLQVCLDRNLARKDGR
jgi:N-formylglutamate deformylase